MVSETTKQVVKDTFNPNDYDPTSVVLDFTDELQTSILQVKLNLTREYERQKLERAKSYEGQQEDLDRLKEESSEQSEQTANTLEELQEKQTKWDEEQFKKIEKLLNTFKILDKDDSGTKYLKEVSTTISKDKQIQDIVSPKKYDPKKILEKIQGIAKKQQEQQEQLTKVQSALEDKTDKKGKAKEDAKKDEGKEKEKDEKKEEKSQEKKQQVKEKKKEQEKELDLEKKENKKDEDKGKKEEEKKQEKAEKKQGKIKEKNGDKEKPVSKEKKKVDIGKNAKKPKKDVAKSPGPLAKSPGPLAKIQQISGELDGKKKGGGTKLGVKPSKNGMCTCPICGTQHLPGQHVHKKNDDGKNTKITKPAAKVLKPMPAKDDNNQNDVQSSKVTETIGKVHGNIQNLLKDEKFKNSFMLKYTPIQKGVQKTLKKADKQEEKISSDLKETQKGIKKLKKPKKPNFLLKMFNPATFMSLFWIAIGGLIIIALLRIAWRKWKKTYMPKPDGEKMSIFGIEIPGWD